MSDGPAECICFALLWMLHYNAYVCRLNVWWPSSIHVCVALFLMPHYNEHRLTYTAVVWMSDVQALYVCFVLFSMPHYNVRRLTCTADVGRSDVPAEYVYAGRSPRPDRPRRGRRMPDRATSVQQAERCTGSKKNERNVVTKKPKSFIQIYLKNQKNKQGQNVKKVLFSYKDIYVYSNKVNESCRVRNWRKIFKKSSS